MKTIAGRVMTDENSGYKNPLSLYDRALQSFVLRLRPAPVASAIKSVLGVQRRNIDTPQGIFWVDPLSLFGSVLTRSGHYELEMERTFATFLKPGATFVDLGANEGYFTVLGAKLCGPQGRVVAIEPQGRLLPVITENLRLNKIQQVRLVQAAVSDKTGTATMHLAPDVNSGSSSLLNLANYNVATQAVPTRTLAEILDEHNLERVDFMKVDIEGFEWEMLHGALELFASHRIRSIAMEIHNDILRKRGLEPEEIIRILDRCGYRIVHPHGHWVWTL